MIFYYHMLVTQSRASRCQALSRALREMLTRCDAKGWPAPPPAVAACGGGAEVKYRRTNSSFKLPAVWNLLHDLERICVHQPTTYTAFCLTSLRKIGMMMTLRPLAMAV
jgi:hypothetical protein